MHLDVTDTAITHPFNGGGCVRGAGTRHRLRGGDEPEQALVSSTEKTLSDSERAAACSKKVGPLLQAQRDLRARLRVGVIYVDYVRLVGDLAVLRSRIGPITDPKCAEVPAIADRWGFWSDGCGELLPFCPECARREFAPDALASGQLRRALRRAAKSPGS